MKRIITCADCGRAQPHQGRGLCSACMLKHRKAGTLDKKFPRARKSSERKAITIRCLDCQRIRPHHSRRLCTGCVSRNRKAGTLDQYPAKVAPEQVCIHCGTPTTAIESICRSCQREDAARIELPPGRWVRNPRNPLTLVYVESRAS